MENQRCGTIAAAVWNASHKVTNRRDIRTWRNFFNPLSQSKQKRGLSHAELLAQARQQVAIVYNR